MAPTLASLLRRLDPVTSDPATDVAFLHKYAATGDRDALAALVHRHGPLVYRMCRRLLRRDDVEDGFQATFLVLARRASSVQKAGSVGSWLVGVAGRVAREVQRAERRRASREVPLVGEVGVEQEGGEAVLERAEHARLLHEELARLPERLRGPVVACLLHGQTSEEAAAELGTSPRTVRRRVEQAKGVLRARLERRGVAPAVAVVLVPNVESGTAAVTAGLVRKTVEGLNDFLAGGTSPPAVLAQGVVKAMNPWKVIALVVAATFCLTAIGIGLAAGDPPSAPPPVELPAPPAAAGRVGQKAAAQPGTGVARAVAGEADFLRTKLTKLWTGEDRASAWTLSVLATAAGNPVPPPRAGEVRVLYQAGGAPASRTYLEFKEGRLSGAWVDVAGPLDVVLDTLLAREMTRVVLAEHLGRPLPWWVDQGISGASDPAGMLAADARCRAGLAAGRCLRLSALLGVSGVPRDVPRDAKLAAAQAASVIQFLQWVARDTGGPARRRHKAFFEYLVAGPGEGWDAAASGYGFADTAALEAAWLKWLDAPGPRFAPEASSPTVDVPPTIPTTRVRDQ